MNFPDVVFESFHKSHRRSCLRIARRHIPSNQNVSEFASTKQAPNFVPLLDRETVCVEGNKRFGLAVQANSICNTFQEGPTKGFDIGRLSEVSFIDICADDGHSICRERSGLVAANS